MVHTCVQTRLATLGLQEGGAVSSQKAHGVVPQVRMQALHALFLAYAPYSLVTQNTVAFPKVFFA